MKIVGTEISIIRLPQVKARTGLSRSTLYQKIQDGEFPAPVSLGDRAVGWIDKEVSDWIARRVETRDVSRTAGSAQQ